MRTLAPLSLALLLLPPLAQAKEYPIGEPQLCPGLEVGAVYLQPVSYTHLTLPTSDLV